MSDALLPPTLLNNLVDAKLVKQVISIWLFRILVSDPSAFRFNLSEAS